MSWYSMVGPRALLQIILIFTTVLFGVGAWIAYRAQRTVVRPSFRSTLAGVYVGLVVMVVLRSLTLLGYPDDVNDDAAMIPLAATTALALSLMLMLNWIAVSAMETAKTRLHLAKPEYDESAMAANQLLDDIDTELIDRVLRGDIPSKAKVEEFKQRHETLTQAMSARA